MQPLGDRGWINRVEYIRLLEQALDNLGFSSLATQLERQSGVRCQSADVVRLRAACLEGDWATAVSLVENLQFRNADQKTHAKFIVLEQKYLEVVVESRGTQEPHPETQLPPATSHRHCTSVRLQMPFNVCARRSVPSITTPNVCSASHRASCVHQVSCLSMSSGRMGCCSHDNSY